MIFLCIWGNMDYVQLRISWLKNTAYFPEYAKVLSAKCYEERNNILTHSSNSNKTK